MKSLLDIAAAGVIGGSIVLGAAYSVPMVERASAMSETAVEVQELSAAPALGDVRDLPLDQDDVRRVGPRFYPDPANALDFKSQK